MKTLNELELNCVELAKKLVSGNKLFILNKIDTFSDNEDADYKKLVFTSKIGGYYQMFSTLDVESEFEFMKNGDVIADSCTHTLAEISENWVILPVFMSLFGQALVGKTFKDERNDCIQYSCKGIESTNNDNSIDFNIDLLEDLIAMIEQDFSAPIMLQADMNHRIKNWEQI
jgi:hypothetical protein